MNTLAADSPARPLRTRARLVLGVFKLRIGALIMICALAGAAIAPGQQPEAWRLAAVALAVLVAAACAGGFNQYVEADADRLMARTRMRAFASGELSRSRWWLVLFGATLAAATALAWWASNALAALFVLLGALFYGVVYTLWLKRRTWLNIVIGGLAGSFAVLAGAAAVDPALSALPWTLALVLFLWTPPHFWSLAIACQADYAAAGVPMLPVVLGPERAARIVHMHALLLVAATLALPLLGSGWIVLLAAAAGGAHLLRKTAALARMPTRQSAMSAFFASMVQLSVLLAAVAIDALLH